MTDYKQETRTSTLELLGNPEEYSGMPLSVGVTCGITTQLLLDSHPALTTLGVLALYSTAMCDPIRESLSRRASRWLRILSSLELSVLIYKEN